MPQPTIPASLANQVDPVVHFIASRLDAFGSDIQEIKGVQKDMAASFAKLIVIEDRQTATMAGLERAFHALEKVETKLDASTTENREACKKMEREAAEMAKRVVELEKSEPMQAQTSKWVLSAAWGSLALLAGFIIPKMLDRMFS